MLAVFLREHVSNLVGMLKMYFYGESKINRMNIFKLP